MTADKTNQCEICGNTHDSRIDITKHLMTDHTLKERQNALIARRFVEERKNP